MKKCGGGPPPPPGPLGCYGTALNAYMYVNFMTYNNTRSINIKTVENLYVWANK